MIIIIYLNILKFLNMKKSIKKLLKLYAIITLFSFATLSSQAFAAKNPEYKITIKNHKFFPQNLEIPAGKKVKLIVENQDASAEEFESHDLNREKIISGNKSVIIYVGPLKEGTYKYFGEFNPKTAQGTITVN
jgi:plastocyanin